MDWVVGRGVPSQPTRDLGERRELPQQGLAHFKGHRKLLLHLYADALSSSTVFHVTYLGRGQCQGLRGKGGQLPLPLPHSRTAPVSE